MAGCFMIFGALVLILCLFTTMDNAVHCAIGLFVVLFILSFIYYIYAQKKQKRVLKEVCELLSKIHREDTGWQESQWVAVNEHSPELASVVQVSCKKQQFALLNYNADKSEATNIIIPFKDLHKWQAIKICDQKTKKIEKVAIKLTINNRDKQIIKEISLYDSVAVDSFDSDMRRCLKNLQNLQAILTLIKKEAA